MKNLLSARQKAFVGLASMLAMSGCSVFDIGEPEYGCPGMPTGVQCMSVSDVYAMTNDGNVPLPMNPVSAGPAEEPVEEGQTQSVSEIKENRAGGVPGVVSNYVAPRLPDQPVPIRTPAQVMRVWIAPWEDAKGDLIVTGYLYTEIEPRRWVIGNPAPSVSPVLRPLQSVQSPESREAASKE